LNNNISLFYKKIKVFHIFRGFTPVHWIEKISTKLFAEIILQNSQQVGIHKIYGKLLLFYKIKKYYYILQRPTSTIFILGKILAKISTFNQHFAAIMF